MRRNFEFEVIRHPSTRHEDQHQRIGVKIWPLSPPHPPKMLLASAKVENRSINFPKSYSEAHPNNLYKESRKSWNLNVNPPHQCIIFSETEHKKKKFHKGSNPKERQNSQKEPANSYKNIISSDLLSFLAPQVNWLKKKINTAGQICSELLNRQWNSIHKAVSPMLHFLLTTFDCA